jgi:alpha-galactosidase
MTQLDPFTLNLLENDEVLAIDQDALGKEATCIIRDNDLRVYEKELEDGGRAVGFFNLGREPLKLDFKQFTQLNLSGKQHVRDLWRQKNLPDVDTDGTIELTVPAHGVELYKFTSAK